MQLDNLILKPFPLSPLSSSMSKKAQEWKDLQPAEEKWIIIHSKPLKDKSSEISVNYSLRSR